MRKLSVALIVATLLTIALVAVAQEDDVAQYANLDQLGHA